MAIPLIGVALSGLIKAVVGKKSRVIAVKVTGVKITKKKLSQRVIKLMKNRKFKKAGKDKYTKQTKAKVTISVKFVNNFDKFMKRLQESLEEVVNEMGQFIKDESFKLCPRDTGTLERTAAHIEDHDAFVKRAYIEYGPAFSNEAVKVVDRNAFGAGIPAQGQDYTLFAHFGNYNLGPGTLAKNPNAGPLFLSRPMEQNTDFILEKIRKAVEDVVRAFGA